MELLQTRSVSAISFGELAKQAGVSRRTVYRHFDDHQALGLAVAMHVMPFDKPPTYSTVDDMWALMPTYAKHLEDNPWAYQAMLGTPSRQSEALEMLDRVYEELTAGMTPETKKAFLAMMELVVCPHSFHVLMHVRGLSADDAVSTIRWTMKVLLEAAGNPSPLQSELDDGV